jgi:hypothetical protein
MELHLKIIGFLLIILALLHFTFPKYFKWKQELTGLSLINRQLMYIHALFIALIIFLIGLLCITSANELLNTSLGKRVSLGLGIFWAARLWVQFFGYSSRVWRGKSFETAVHILFAVFWIYLSAVFILVYLA